MTKNSITEQNICVLTLTGKVGKSTFSNDVLGPRMPTAKKFRLETINLSGISDGEVMQLKGKDFIKLQNELSKTNCAIVDVGASNVESFLLAMTQQPGSHQSYDAFIIPVEATAAKVDAIDEFIKTVTILHNLGVEPERIKVVFNKLAVDAELEYEVRKIIKFHDVEKWFSLDLRAKIHEAPAFAAISEVGRTFLSMLNDTTDYRLEFKNTPAENTERRLELTKLMRAQSAVKPVNKEFDIVFDALFGRE